MDTEASEDQPVIQPCDNSATDQAIEESRTTPVSLPIRPIVYPRYTQPLHVTSPVELSNTIPHHMFLAVVISTDNRELLDIEGRSLGIGDAFGRKEVLAVVAIHQRAE